MTFALPSFGEYLRRFPWLLSAAIVVAGLLAWFGKSLLPYPGWLLVTPVIFLLAGAHVLGAFVFVADCRIAEAEGKSKHSPFRSEPWIVLTFLYYVMGRLIFGVPLFKPLDFRPEGISEDALALFAWICFAFAVLTRVLAIRALIRFKRPEARFTVWYRTTLASVGK
ncbi:MAG TPA: hypothetical protein VD967_02500 [Candidatus Paceibacterota bacterium]|nr:hypothetical protein [Candidatus Paceibacterota bacterium]